MIELLVNILIAIGAFLLMEGIAWASHKYIMHGFLWSWHRSHHKVHKHTLERNDLFALVFSLPCAFSFYYSAVYLESYYLTSIAIGILAYGLFYFIFHDIIVHRRIKIKFKAKNTYLKRIINAHYIHHEKHSKEGGKAFGFLYAPKKYDAKTENRKAEKVN